MSTLTHISFEQYAKMVEAGAFDGERRQRVELIRGEIRPMTPIGTHHAAAVAALTDWSIRSHAPETVCIHIQSTLAIPPLDSAPEPDLIWLALKDYREIHPLPEDVLLVIEVAMDTLNYDLGRKARLYAEAGIADYWVVDLANQSIYVHRRPQPDGYAEVTVIRDDEEARPLRFPEIALRPSLLFG